MLIEMEKKEFREYYSIWRLTPLLAFCIGIPMITLISGSSDKVTYFKFLYNPIVFPIFGFFLFVFFIIGIGILILTIKALLGVPAVDVRDGHIRANLVKNRVLPIDSLIEVMDGPRGSLEFQLTEGEPLKLPVMMYKDRENARFRLRNLVP